ncbi:hypothetical protein [Hymenobacter properus]|uniref:Uncharacterized protein n=1 Tax=Hymenobacter properus TaxID=2791026 RepID=A0A931BGN1_9BACT|nr:hypothetical protein [Hymenobacter properus]MBF9142116.1 hypothetical protein [Hymenobacter properus]MBR7720923.1 hypothetical protein [Microvirga sp. SRT04]
MRLAFDLDNTLIRCSHDFPLEKPQRRFWAKLLRPESLRHGIKELTDYCRQRGWEVWVYTTSYRSAWRIRRIFWLHGIRLDGVVNQPRHDREARARCTKHPPSFGIDLLIDDSEGVRLEGERHGFRVLVVKPEDERWAAKLRAVLDSF